METKEIISLKDATQLFHAQSIIGYISYKLPWDRKYDKAREMLFECSMKIIEVMNILSENE